MNRRLVYWLAVLAQLLFLGWIVVAQERRLEHGTRVVLAIEPFDPIDPLSGRYLAIRPKVGRIDVGQVATPIAHADPIAAASVFAGGEIAVTLKEEGARWVAAAIEHVAPGARDPSRPWLRGKVTAVHGSTLVIEYGLERFYIPSTAADPSPLLWQEGHELAIAVRLDVAGHGTIEDLLVDGAPFQEWNRAQPK